MELSIPSVGNSVSPTSFPVRAVVKLWSGEVDASGELSGAGSFTAADFEPTAQMPVDELFSHIGGFGISAVAGLLPAQGVLCCAAV